MSKISNLANREALRVCSESELTMASTTRFCKYKILFRLDTYVDDHLELQYVIYDKLTRGTKLVYFFKINKNGT